MAASSDLEKSAKEAFVDDDFELAADLYTQAIAMDPTNADLYSDRAQTNIKLRNYAEAVADANKAIELDSSMSKAYFRKGTACIKLEEYETAKAALEAGASLAQGDSRFTKLIKECDELIAEESGFKPMPVAFNAANNVVQPSDVPQPPAAEIDEKIEPEINVSSRSTAATPAKPKYRHEFYQKPEEVVVTIFAKRVPAENVVVDFGEQILSIAIDVPGEDAYHFQPRLFGKIVPEKCRYEVMSTKIEIRLAKAEAIVWNCLEFTREITVLQKSNVSSSVTSQKPAYPTSRTKAVDWDKLEAQVKKEEKDEKLDGDAAVNKLFRDIYKDADDDMKRAMSKSYLESNGTVLSTNWKDVGAKKVESTPPDGMEVKKWEY